MLEPKSPPNDSEASRASQRRRQSTECRSPPLWSSERHQRAQSTVIGFMLVVGIIAMTFVLLQHTAAPQVQKQTEVSHSRAVAADLTTIRANLLSTGSNGLTESAVVQMGGNYPEYLVLIQPPGPSGSLRTSETRQMALAGASSPEAETSDFLDGGTISMKTQQIRYQPHYNQLEQVPTTVIANSVMYDDYPNRNRVLASPTIVDGRYISLMSVVGNFDRGQAGPLQLRTTPLSASGKTTRIKSASGTHIRLRVQSALSLSTWRSMLSDDIDSDTSPGDSTDNDGRYIAEITEDTSTNPSTKVIHLEKDVNYRLNMARVGVLTGNQAEFGDAQTPDAAYLTISSNPEPVVTEETATQLTAQLRDKFNNPVSDKKISASASDGSLDRVEALTNANGKVTFTYTADEITDPTCNTDHKDETVTMTVDRESGSHYEVTFQIKVQNAYGSQGCGNNGNGNGNGNG